MVDGILVIVDFGITEVRLCGQKQKQERRTRRLAAGGRG